MSLDAIIHRKRPSWVQKLREAPSITIAQTLHSQRAALEKSSSKDLGSGIVIVCVSDTHNSQPALPPGDLLIHAGDLTQHGTAAELQDQLDWINSQSHPWKIVIAGNHDRILDTSQAVGREQRSRSNLRWGDVIYLQDSTVNLKSPGGRNLTIYGSPWTKKHGNWAFQYDPGVDKFGGKVDDEVDVLVTHSAPKFHLDVAGWGEEFLLHELWRTKPRLHVFGHLHEGYGRETLVYDRFEELYELVCAGHAGFPALMEMSLLLAWMLIFGINRHAPRTTLVNACAVGGLVDERAHRPQLVVV